MKNKRHCSNKRKHQADITTDDNDLSQVIDNVVRQAKKKLHRTKHPDDSTQHRAYVCIACDCFIMGNESLRIMTRQQLKPHKHRLGIREYEQYHKVKLSATLISQYHVPTLPNMLLSRRSRKLGSFVLTVDLL